MSKLEVSFIYWFAYYNLDSPSVRYRAKYPLDHCREKQGIGSYLVVPSYRPAPIFKFLQAYLSALFFRKKDSLIIIQRVQSNFIYARLLRILVKFQHKNTIYDLDDADYLEYKSEHILHFASKCEKVAAGSVEIAKYLSQFNKNVFHLTSPTVELGIRKKLRNPLLTVGWIGGLGGDHKTSLFQLIFPALLALPIEVKFILLGVTEKKDATLVHSYFRDCKNLTLEMPMNIDWNDERAIQLRIASFDIGIATLLNNPIQLSKSGIKAKQYLNNGVPVLSTNLPENNSVVEDGYNGFLCSSSEDFTKRILHISRMSELQYAQLSSNAWESKTLPR